MTTPAQVSLTARVTAGVAQRIGSLKEPLTIINQSNDQVWLSDTAGVTPETGTPLPGQTSLQWARPGFLYASLDPAATADVDLVLSTGVDQWQPSPIAVAAAAAAALFASGVRIAVVEQQLYAGTLFGATTGLLDVSALSSFTVKATAVAPGPSLLAVTQFDDAGSVIAFEELWSADNGTVMVSGPVIGKFLEVNSTSGTGFNAVVVTASTRSTDRFRASGHVSPLDPATPNSDGVLFDKLGAALAPAATYVVELPLRPGRIFTRLTAGAAGMRFDFLPAAMSQQFSVAVAAGTAVVSEIVLPRRSTRLTVTNTGGVAAAWGAYVTYEVT